jgi:hypothetical protein
VKPDAGPEDVGNFVADNCKHAPTQPAQVQVGQGMLAYYALATDDEVHWERGPQGGHHIWLAVRVIGLRQSGTLTEVTVVDQSVTPPLTLQQHRVVFDFKREDGGYCVLYGMRVQLDQDSAVDVSLLDGHRARVTVSVQDPEGAGAVGTVDITLRAPRDS